MRTKINADIIEQDILNYDNDLLDILLKDRTTNKNIIWATNDYVQLGSQYGEKEEILIPSITGDNSKVIQPRIIKSKQDQDYRTKYKAEVFTPSWVCNKQNNLIDEQWFKRNNVFNTQLNKSWRSSRSKIEFPNIKGGTWKDYVDARRIEIACGEAPYLASRYDTVTGEVIDVPRRIGLLDRKLRIINENINEEGVWFNWVIRAYQSIYAYEFQGDNLLLARENLLYTFVDNIKCKLGRYPNLNEYKKIATIISWNVWQMDGLTFTIPFGGVQDITKQQTIFDYIQEPDSNKLCIIKDWRSKQIIKYSDLFKGE